MCRQACLAQELHSEELQKAHWKRHPSLSSGSSLGGLRVDFAGGLAFTVPDGWLLVSLVA